MMAKYSVESDFLQNYLNFFIISRFYKNDENSSILNDAQVFNSCVHLNPSSFNLANCADRRERVESFISSNEEAFNKFRNIAVENCKSDLLNAHGINVHLEKDLRNTRPSELNLLKLQIDKAEERLDACIKSNL
jgi:hypothetical protein